jgi:hypothetical protein
MPHSIKWPRDNFLRNAGSPAAVAPCAWKADFAIPLSDANIACRSAVDAYHCNLVHGCLLQFGAFNSTTMAQFDAGSGVRHPHHQWPGTARPSTSAGLSWIDIASLNLPKPLRFMVAWRDLRMARVDRRCASNSFLNTPRVWINRLR